MNFFYIVIKVLYLFNFFLPQLFFIYFILVVIPLEQNLLKFLFLGIIGFITGLQASEILLNRNLILEISKNDHEIKQDYEKMKNHLLGSVALLVTALFISFMFYNGLEFNPLGLAFSLFPLGFIFINKIYKNQSIRTRGYMLIISIWFVLSLEEFFDYFEVNDFYLLIGYKFEDLITSLPAAFGVIVLLMYWETMDKKLNFDIDKSSNIVP